MYVVGLGSNLGARFATFARVVELFDQSARGGVVACSRVYESAPLGPPQPMFLNAAVLIASELTPEAQLEQLLSIEAMLGRVRQTRWGARTIDLDLLWGPRPFSSARLFVPHRELSNRWFALAPLIDVAHTRTELRALERASQAQLTALGGVPDGTRWASFGGEARRLFDTETTGHPR